MRSLMMAVAVVAVVGTALAATADGLGPGMRLPEITLNDQHDEPGHIDATTNGVLFTRDMDASKIAKAALEDDGDLLLEKAGVIYVADVARMPRLVTRFFAVPAMRKRPYRMLLDRDGKATASFPTEDEHVTLIRLDGLAIASVEYFDSAWALRRALRACTAERATDTAPSLHTPADTPPDTPPDAPAAAPHHHPAAAAQPDS